MIDNYRCTLLGAAANGVKKWCCAADQLVDGRRRPDTFWMELFGGLEERRVTQQDAHLFLVSFQLTNRVVWDKPAVADIISDIQTAATFDPLVDVPALGKRLSEANRRRTQQTSAASKIATFARPTSRVYIWDALASRSARYRDWERGGRTARMKRKILFTSGRDHDYPAFYAACDRALEDEREKADFVEARDTLIASFRAAAGAMADPQQVPDDFIERRFLDKLMYAEGWILDRNVGPPDKWTTGSGM